MIWKDVLNQTFSDDERPAAAQALTRKCGYAAAALTIVPVPGSEVVAVMPIHVGMVVGIAHIYGQSLSKQSASDLVLRILATAGLSLVGSRVATTAAKLFLPGLGGLLAAPFMFASTMALGAAARAYFAAGGDLGDEALRDVFQRAKKEAKESFDPAEMRSEAAKRAAQEASAEARATEPTERLEKLKAMLDRGLIDQAEYDRTRARILDEL